MILVKARTKELHEFPPFELCCEEMKTIASRQTGLIVDIDLDDQSPYPESVTGHCGQELPYVNSVMTYLNGESLGYIPFDLIHISEGVA